MYRDQTSLNNMMMACYRDSEYVPDNATTTGYKLYRRGFTSSTLAHVWTGILLQYVISEGDDKWNPFHIKTNVS